MSNRLSIFAIAMALMASMPAAVSAQSIQPLTNQPPASILISFQMTDGTVLAQSSGDTGRWYRLTPDINGSYVNGTWAEVKSLPTGYAPNAFAAGVLADGRLVIEGGEYNFSIFTLTNKGAIYDPVANSWTELTPPAGWHFIGDSPSSILRDGKFLVGDKLHKWDALLDPRTLTWTAPADTGKLDFNAEEGWTLLPDGTVLTVDVKKPLNSERYDPAKQVWASAGSTVVNLIERTHGEELEYGHGHYYHPPGETGPAVLRPDGTVFATGALNDVTPGAVTAIYSEPSKANPAGKWAAGPSFPSGEGAGDSSASLLPSGRVLVESDSNTLYEFDGKNLIQELVKPDYYVFLMILPSGGVIMSGLDTEAVYTSSGTYKASWAPAVSSCPTTVSANKTYKITGTQFNGRSQANGFGDEDQSPTNFPLVRITNTSTGHVFYARTHDHSTMGVATGSKPVSTYFDVPAGIESGASQLEVVANGIPSQPVVITVK